MERFAVLSFPHSDEPGVEAPWPACYRLESLFVRLCPCQRLLAAAHGGARPTILRDKAGWPHLKACAHYGF